MPDPLCERCQNPFVPRGRGGKPQRFCGVRCLRAAQQTRHRAKLKASGVWSAAKALRQKKEPLNETHDVGRGKARGRASTSEIEYSDAEREFLVAVDDWKRTKHRQFPTLSDLLAILTSLGYEKVKT